MRCNSLLASTGVLPVDKSNDYFPITEQMPRNELNDARVAKESVLMHVLLLTEEFSHSLGQLQT